MAGQHTDLFTTVKTKEPNVACQFKVTSLRSQKSTYSQNIAV